MRNLKINNSYSENSTDKQDYINPINLDEVEEINRWAESRIIHLVFSLALILLGTLTVIIFKMISTLI